MDSLLDLASIATSVAYLSFLGAGLWAEYRVKTLAALQKACQHYWTAVALAALSLVINLASVTYDGWWGVLAPAGSLVCCLSVANLTGHKRDRKVIQEMQRDLGRES